MSTVWSCGTVYFDDDIWYLPQQSEFKTFLKLSYCHTYMLTPNTFCAQPSDWFLLARMLNCLMVSCDNSEGELSLMVK